MKKFEEYLQENKMIRHTFLAMQTNDPYSAEKHYIERTGFQPTILLVRPDFIPSKDHPLLTRWRRSPWGMILVSHLVKPSEVDDDTDLSSVFKSISVDVDDPQKNKRNISFPISKIGRPEIPKAICPHCHNLIKDFETLGYWYGWAFGITPPYWEELRLYVFKRDDYTCQNCKKKFPPAYLQAHHITHKEDGGEDGARNLQTLCVNCHMDLKPIFSDEEGEE